MQIITKDSEAFIVDLLKTLAGQNSSYYALSFNFSLLEKQSKRASNIKIATNIVHDVFKEEQGFIFVMHNFDVIIIYKGAKKSLIEKAIFQLRYLFSDDVLATKEDYAEREGFYDIYDLAFNFKNFVKLVTDLYNQMFQNTTQQADGEREGQIRNKARAKEQEHRQQQETQERGQEIYQQKTQEKEQNHHAKNIDVKNFLSNNLQQSFYNANLENLRNEILTANLDDVFKNQPIIKFSRNEFPKALYYEIYLQMSELKETLGKQDSILRNRWLFRHLTETLDFKTLEILSRYIEDERFLGSFSINLNISTILTDEFLGFCKNFIRKLGANFVIEIDIADVLCNLDYIERIQKIAKENNLRLCLDGICHNNINAINPKEFGFDLIKVKWQREIIHKKVNLDRVIKKFGINRVILCWCDEENAIEYGKELGISIFQGRYIDRILNPNARYVN